MKRIVIQEKLYRNRAHKHLDYLIFLNLERFREIVLRIETDKDRGFPRDNRSK